MRKILILFIVVILISCSENRQIQKTAITDAPEWSKHVVWYQVFVERFRNGDTTNDPTREDIKGAYPGVIPEKWEITPWTHDWYKPDPWFKELEGKKDFNGNPISHINQKTLVRRYGGDLQGVLDKIDYLDSLGVTAIYFNPLNDAPSLHKYDAKHWRHIDRNFGPSPEKDVKLIAAEIPDDPTTWKMTGADKMFVDVIKAFHDKGIRVILDYSWNHTGQTFWAWEDILKNGEKSKYRDWYWVKKFDDPETHENEFEYRGWMNVPDLPEIKETEFVDHAKSVKAFEGNIANEKTKNHIFNVCARWLDPNGDGDPSDGVDGFRLDVAADLPLGFWRDYRKYVRNINPDAYLLGEIWWEEFPDKFLDPKPYLEGDIFDGVMNYRWYRAARHFFAKAPAEINVSEFVDSLNSFRSNLREQNNYAMMNLAASHDAPRVLTSLYNHEKKYKYEAAPSPGNDYKINKPDEKTLNTLKLLLTHQFTYIGSPHIWAGDEMGMWGADMDDTRKPLIWPDYDFEPEKVHPYGKNRPVDEVKFDERIFSMYREMIKIRNDNPVLQTGKLEFLITDNERKLLAYSRYDGKNEAIAIFNVSDKTGEIDISVKYDNQYEEILSGYKVQRKDKGALKIQMPPESAAILIQKL